MRGKILRKFAVGVLLTTILVVLVGCSLEVRTKTILDRADKTMGTAQAGTEDTVKLKEMPDALKMAIVDVEDNRFYEHNGIDLQGIGRAIYRDVTTLTPAEGGSTLTQQLARNVYLTQDRTFARKVNEIVLALELERKYSKDEILEMYLNRVYFGNGATGIRAAAETYFGKGQDLKSLSLAQCALLAGLPNAPTALNPWVEENQADALDRRNHVLEAMYKNGDITKEQMKEAQGEPLELMAGKNEVASSRVIDA